MKSVNLKQNEKDAVAELKNELKKRFNILDVCIFGSKARGESSPGSDIDIMIEVETGTAEIESEIDDLAYEINLTYDCLISTTIFRKKELEEGPLSESPLYKVIDTEGIKV